MQKRLTFFKFLFDKTLSICYDSVWTIVSKKATLKAGSFTHGSKEESREEENGDQESQTGEEEIRSKQFDSLDPPPTVGLFFLPSSPLPTFVIHS